MAYYVFIHSDSPDGVRCDLQKIEGNSMVAARANFQRQQLKQIEEYAGADDVDGQIEYLLRDETKYERITFLEVHAIQDFDYEQFRALTVKTLQHGRQQAAEEEEYREYKRLQNKYQNKEQN